MTALHARSVKWQHTIQISAELKAGLSGTTHKGQQEEGCFEVDYLISLLWKATNSVEYERS